MSVLIHGAAGKSAYQQAVEAGYIGTEAEFYAALVALKDGPFLPLAGGTLTGPLDVDSGDILLSGWAPTRSQRILGGFFGYGSRYGIEFSDNGVIIGSTHNAEEIIPNATFTGQNLALSGGRITGVAIPVDASDAANKEYVDSKSVQLGTCSTAAGTAAKAVTLSGFTLQTGAVVCVKFTYANTNTSATLNVNATGAKSIRVNGAVIKSNMILAGMYALFQYDGTYWQLLNPAGTDVSALLPKSGGTMSGTLYAQTNTSYTTYQVRNAALVTSAPSSLSNGAVALVYS